MASRRVSRHGHVSPGGITPDLSQCDKARQVRTDGSVFRQNPRTLGSGTPVTAISWTICVLSFYFLKSK